MYKPYKAGIRALNELYDAITRNFRFEIKDHQEVIKNFRKSFNLPVEENCNYFMLFLYKNKPYTMRDGSTNCSDK